jgi:hypothetical protein
MQLLTHVLTVSKQNAAVQTAVTTVAKKYWLVITGGLRRVSSTVRAVDVNMA